MEGDETRRETGAPRRQSWRRVDAAAGSRVLPNLAVCVAGSVPSWTSVGHELDFRGPFPPGFGSIKAH